MCRHVGLFTAGALMPVILIIRFPFGSELMGVQHRDLLGLQHLAADSAAVGLYTFFRLRRRRSHFARIARMCRHVGLFTAGALVPVILIIRFPFGSELMG